MSFANNILNGGKKRNARSRSNQLMDFVYGELGGFSERFMAED
jgi:hypothetical protein